ncbi:PTS sugar transporter subunit IIA [Enterococcus sp. BWB1-3]|uniref:PTS sugar transporter subunit IIA n=1 Tax=unclassified Enterococcus TaxID=2608891 RepID=UPI0019218281|nr:MULTISPECIES: PTS sugar transporter subunit IIA [unclassified Enterococcus]MBL1229102.1 PTS sugar transporter subunit IIA [Enterococcus sp. BWB1-3]MCB5953483.1 PTS sugar transporter subunit IIA [Enterococcus sp. CWB-B31]
MDVENLVEEELVLFTTQKDQLLLLEETADLLEQQGKTKSTYKQAVIEREKIFPTGLETEHIGVAIPHADSIHVNESAIAIVVLKHQVPFIQMGSEDEQVQVEVLFMLALKKAEDQLEMLQVLVELIQDERNMDKLRHAKDAAGIIQCIRQFSANQ